MKRPLATGLAFAVVLSGAGARAAEPATSADQLFKEAKALRVQGKTEEACSLFAESQKLEPGVGVGLYLGDCYENLGRSASAWSVFREVQRFAGERRDARSEVARKRADALELRLSRLMIVVDPPNAAVALDGQTLAPSSLNVAFPVDPGDHVVTLDLPGRAPLIERAHVEADAPVLVVHLVHAEPPPKEPAAVAPPPAAPVPVPPVSANSDDTVPRRWMLVGLLGAGAAGVGTGAALLAVKNHSMTNAPSGTPQLNEGAAAASVVAFSAGGSALVAAVIVYLAAPRRTSSAFLQLAPATFPGGGGAALLGSF